MNRVTITDKHTDATHTGDPSQREANGPLDAADCSRLPELTDEAIEDITNSAYAEYRKWSRAIRGQTITYMDGIEFWVIKATLQWVRSHSENTPAEPPVGSGASSSNETT